VFVTSARVGYRKPHPRIYQATLERTGFGADDAVFIGDSLRTDVLGPQRVGICSVLLARDAERQLHREQVSSLAAATHLILRDLALASPAHQSRAGLCSNSDLLRVRHLKRRAGRVGQPCARPDRAQLGLLMPADMADRVDSRQEGRWPGRQARTW
jgi:HAD-hyrolase-like